jgi:metallo-beta-lactamase family protein
MNYAVEPKLNPKSEVSPLRLRFLGAASTVTGSRYFLTNDRINVLVDCGLFQGLKELRLKNWDRFPINPKTIDAIVLTHVHLDHSGYIPRLVKEGFKGKIFCTRATLGLCKILLTDAGRIQEEDAEWLSRKKNSKHSPALPLFTEKDAEAALKQFVPVSFDESFEVTEGVRATF